MGHTIENKASLIARVRRIAGQMAAVEKALDDGAGCAVVLHQVAGARGAINGLMDELVADHVRQHVAAPGLDDATRAAGAEDLIAAVRRYAR